MKKKSADCLPVANRRAKGGGLKGGLAEIERGAARRREPPSPRVPSTVLDRARRARVGAAAGATAVARLEERRATRGCAGQATPRALAAIMLLTSSAFSASGRACRVAGRDDGKSVARVHERDTRRVLPEATRRGRGGARRSVPLEANAWRDIAAAFAGIDAGAFLKTGGQIFRTAVPSKIYRVSRIVRLVPKAYTAIFFPHEVPSAERSKRSLRWD